LISTKHNVNHFLNTFANRFSRYSHMSRNYSEKRL